MIRTVTVLMGTIAFSLAAASADAASAATSGIALEAYTRPGTLVTLATGRKLNIRCAGSGSPTIVLTAGAGEQSLTWRSLQTQLAGATRVCAWDRAGFGFSDASSQTQDVVHTTEDLEAVLMGAKIHPPYLLVGHSLGSYESLMFSFRHPHEVTGMVLIDPSAAYQDRRFRQAAPDTYAVIDTLQQQQAAVLKSCIDGMTRGSNDAALQADCFSQPVEGYPASLNRALNEQERNLGGRRNFLSLIESVSTEKDAQELQGAWKSLGSMPLVVLTAGAPPPIPLAGAGKAQLPQLQAEWSRMHDEIAALSTRGVNRTVPGATHYIYIEQQAKVAEAVLDVLASARGHR